VRGDSLRDLYAKTLALLGLGLLAGVGALVDYWPVGLGTPQVAAASLAVPEPLAVGAATDLAIPVTVIEPAGPAHAVAANLALLTVVSAGVPVVGRQLSLSEPVAPAVAAPVPAVPAAMPVAELALAAPAPSPGPDFDPALVYQLGGSEEESGLLSNAVDMMKSTGSTLARGGAATGASLVGAFRVVSGAFKKLKFF
jgi:hypothetical protein